MRKIKTKCKRTRTLKTANCNARTLLPQEKFTEIESEVKNIKWDLIGMGEMKRNGENLVTIKSSHILYHIGHENKSSDGIDLFIHKRHADNIVSKYAVSARVAD